MWGIVRSNFYCPLLKSKSPLICIVGKQQKQAAITELLLFRKSTGVILRDTLPAWQRICANGPFEDCQVRMFLKQRALPSAHVCEAGLIVKCECLWSSRTGGSSSYLLLKRNNFAAAKTVNSLLDVPTHTNVLSTSHWRAFSNVLHKRVIWNLASCEAASKTRLKHLLAAEKVFILKQK